MAVAETQPAAALEEYDFEASIGYWTILAARAFQKALGDELAPHGITFRQSQVLGWLVLHGEQSQVELAGRMMIEPATLVGVLDRMERDGLISRIASPSDRRCKLIRINPAASEVWSKVLSCARRVRTRASAGLTPSQFEALRDILKTVLNNLDDEARTGRECN